MFHNPINIPAMFLFGGDSKKKKFEASRMKALEFETKILATQGLLLDQNVWVHDVPIKGIKDAKEPQFIHTIEVGRGNQEKILLIHGYGGTGVFMWKILAQLAPYAHVYAIDLYG